MATGLFALLDDIAALARLAAASMDDIAAGAAKASSKAVGVVIDDAAVTPQYVRGLSPARELPIIKKIAIGSIRNKLVFILPVALVLSEFLPALLTPLLMLGGTYLCFEGAEKIIEKLRPSRHVTKAPSVLRGEEAENQVVSSAVRTDFILSAEIMVISLNEVADHTLWIRAAILFLVAIVITVAVYGVVGLLVKLDDIGRALTRRDSELSQKFGRALMNAMPRVMATIAVIGTVAMLWVGGHIIIVGMAELGFTPILDAIHRVTEPISVGALAWLVDTFFSAIFGLVWGMIIALIVHLLPFGHDDSDELTLDEAISAGLVAGLTDSTRSPQGEAPAERGAASDPAPGQSEERSH